MSDLSNMGLDPDVKEQSGAFTVWNPGKYLAVITGDQITTTKAGNGKILELKLQCTTGQYAGEIITDRLNILNPSTIAQQIGQGQLKRICTLCKVPYPPTNTTGLYGKPLLITVGVEEFVSNTTGKALSSNKITGYAAASEAPTNGGDPGPNQPPPKTNGSW